MNSKRWNFGVLLFALPLLAGCGYRLTPFYTPLYKNPPGYSETYKKRLLGGPDEGSTLRSETRKEGSLRNRPSEMSERDKVKGSNKSRDSGSSSRNR